MALTGDLVSIDLANVFQMLLLSRKTGTLEIRSRSGRSEVFLHDESVLWPFDRDAFPAKVRRRLERSGELTREQVARAEASLDVLKGDLFAVLVRMRALDPEQVEAAWRAQMEEEIHELFVDRDATFEFREGQAPQLPGKMIDERYRLNGNSLLMEAARRIDEWGFIRERVPSDRCIFELSAGGDALPEEERDATLAALSAELDGTRDVLAVVERTGLARFAVSKKLALLVEARGAHEVPREMLVERARECLRKEQHEASLALLERALELGADDPAAHEMAALVHEKRGRVGEACRHLALVASALERANDRRAAAEIHLRIRDLLPTDLRCRQRLIHHWLDEPDFFRSTKYAADEESLELVAILKELGNDDEARELLRELQIPFAADAKMVARLSDLALELADPRLAVALLAASAEQLERAGQLPAALRLWRRVRTIEPARPGIEQRIQACQRAAAGAHPGGRIVRLAATLVLLAGGASALIAWNRRALAEWSALPTEELAVAGAFSEAQREIDAFVRAHPFTLAALLARRERASLVARAERDAAAAKEREEFLAAERVRRQKTAQRLLEEANAREADGDVAAALQAMERVAANASDPRFLESNRVAGRLQQLRALAAEEARERAEYDAALQRGDWPALRDAGLALTRRATGRAGVKPVALPIVFRLDPPDAQLALEPAPEGGVPAGAKGVALLPAGTRAKAKATLAGYVAQERTLVVGDLLEVEFRLARAPQLAELPHRPLFAPVVEGGLAWFCCGGGRVVALDVATMEVRWQQRIGLLDELSAPPALEERGLLLVLRDGSRVWLDRADGHEVAREAGAGCASPAPPAAPPFPIALPDGSAFVAASGAIEQHAADGAPVATWQAPFSPEWACVVDGALLVGAGPRIARIVPIASGGAKSGGEERR